MKDKEYAELGLRAMFVPEHVQWPAPEHVHWQQLHRGGRPLPADWKLHGHRVMRRDPLKECRRA